jgi:putative addiction module component (TIGR02574 family)
MLSAEATNRTIRPSARDASRGRCLTQERRSHLNRGTYGARRRQTRTIDRGERMSDMDARKKGEAPSMDEKVRRAQDKRDEIAGSPEDLDLTPEQMAELRRRLADHHLNPGHCRTWEEVRAEIEMRGRQDPDRDSPGGGQG